MDVRAQKLPLDKLIEKMRSDQARVCQQLIRDYQKVFTALPGSISKHQTWPGGYLSHIEETMNIALVLYESLSRLRPLSLDVRDALFVLFLHDLDKLERYEAKGDAFKSKEAYHNSYADRISSLLSYKYGYRLSDNQYNALKYVHGEGKDYSKSERVMLPLAALVHCCDIISARVWFDKGTSHNTWSDKTLNGA